jgi:hypothetical protein
MQLKVDENGLPLLGQFSEEGFIDCVLEIRDLREGSKHYHFHMAASVSGEAVGVNVRVIKGISPGFNENMELNPANVYRDGVQFYRSGPESDRLLVCLAALYELDGRPVRMKEQESFTAIALHQDAIDMESQAIKIKLFGNDKEGDDEGKYYESFFNLDLPNGLVFWNEKDEEYRRPLISSLSTNAP